MIKKVFIVIAGAIVAFFAYNVLWFGTTTINNVADYETIEINGQKYVAKNIDGKFKLRPGSYTVTAYEQLRTPVSVDVTINPFGSTITELPVGNAFNKEVLVTSLVGADLGEGYKIAGSELLEDDSWLVVFIESTDFTREGSLNIYKFDGVRWDNVEVGTGLGEEDYVDSNIPPSVVEYLRTNQ